MIGITNMSATTSMRLSGKVVIVTGSATGIGRAIATRCVAEGARVVIHGLEADLVAAVVADLNAGRDGTAVGHVEDLTAEGCPERLVSLAIASYGRLDSVVNNAAIVTTGDIRSTDTASFNRTLAVNTLAPLQLIQAALPHLAAVRGSVLNIGSVNAYSGEPNLLPYSISKGGLMTLTRNLGDVLFREDGVRVNQINPGWVLTENEILRKRSHGLADDWPRYLPREFCPAGRLIRPEEIAAAAVYWLADECGPMSGQVVDLEQHPFIGRNPPKTILTVPPPPAS
jgi:NAD(P)-dependent dehydrogenase (short-subunit alcohol dehydrogenase family)